jgi:hypothetical protein
MRHDRLHPRVQHILQVATKIQRPSAALFPSSSDMSPRVPVYLYDAIRDEKMAIILNFYVTSSYFSYLPDVNKGLIMHTSTASTAPHKLGNPFFLSSPPPPFILQTLFISYQPFLCSNLKKKKVHSLKHQRQS